VRYLQQAPVERAGHISRRLRGCFFSRNGESKKENSLQKEMAEGTQMKQRPGVF
jgi:hypothetical protein